MSNFYTHSGHPLVDSTDSLRRSIRVLLWGTQFPAVDPPDLAESPHDLYILSALSVDDLDFLSNSDWSRATRHKSAGFGTRGVNFRPISPYRFLIESHTIVCEIRSKENTFACSSSSLGVSSSPLHEMPIVGQGKDPRLRNSI